MSGAPIPFDQIQAVALAQADRLLTDWFPHGRRVGREFKVGSIRGERGDSLSVNLNTGLWKDFASGESGHDLIDLRAAARHGGDRIVAARDLGELLGLANGSNGHAQPASKATGAAWQSMIPPPDGAPRPPESVLAGFDVIHEYTDHADQVTHYVGRIEARGDRRKLFIPLTYGLLDGKLGWHKKHPAFPRPLYGLNRLASMPAAVVLLCEGEKAADAAQAMFREHACLSWAGGTESVELADLAALGGRDVVIWPDADPPGHKAAAKLRNLIPGARVLRVDDLPHGTDAADIAPDDPDAWLAERIPAAEPAEPADEVLSVALAATPITDIPPRPWLYGRFLLSNSAAVLGAVDGGGKGAIAVVMALALITGRPLLGEHVWRTGPVAIVSYEDDENEWRRRIAAACLHYKLDYAEVLSSIRFIRRPRRAVTFGTHDGSGIIEFPDSEDIIKRLIEMRAVLLLVDPFNHAHRLEDGNSNALIARVAGEMTRIGHAARVSVLVLHHLRKGAAGIPDDLMGATSLRATFRSCRILARMEPEIAKRMNIADPWRYIRVAGSKENYAPPPERGTWYRLEGVQLGNGTADYPDGDNVAVATSWTARPMFEGMDGQTLAAVFDALRRDVHGPNRQAKHTPWAGTVLIEVGGRSPIEAGKIITAWLENGVLTRDRYYHEASKNKVERVILDDAKAAEISAEYQDVEGPEK